MKPWDQARAAQHRPLPPKVRKMHGPVGPTHVADGRNDCVCSECVQFGSRACTSCGYHVCSFECRLRQSMTAQFEEHQKELQRVGLYGELRRRYELDERADRERMLLRRELAELAPKSLAPIISTHRYGSDVRMWPPPPGMMPADWP